MNGGTSNFINVAREVLLEVPERYAGYREDLLDNLTKTIGCQAGAVGATTRRRDIRRILEAFGQQVAHKVKEVDE